MQKKMTGDGKTTKKQTKELRDSEHTPVRCSVQHNHVEVHAKDRAPHDVSTDRNPEHTHAVRCSMSETVMSKSLPRIYVPPRVVGGDPRSVGGRWIGGGG